MPADSLLLNTGISVAFGLLLGAAIVHSTGFGSLVMSLIMVGALMVLIPVRKL